MLGAMAVPVIVSFSPSTHAQEDAAAPTKTREAELDELHGLQTRVTEPNICTPAPTSTAVPATPTATTVPPTASGQPVMYDATWEVTVLAIAPTPAGAEVPTQGQLLRLNVAVANHSNDNAFPPFPDWLLTDASGQSYAVDLAASTALAGAGWALTVGPGATDDRSMIFDVPIDIGTSFVLESRVEPSFRVALAIESRG